jgi:hypothetical protein
VKDMDIPNRYGQKRPSPCNIILAFPNKERILNTAREKYQVTYKDRPLRTTAHFSAEILKARRAWKIYFKP